MTEAQSPHNNENIPISAESQELQPLTLGRALKETALATLPFAVTFFINSISRIAPFHFLQNYDDEVVSAFGIGNSFYNIFGVYTVMALCTGLLSKLSPCFGAQNYRLLGYYMHRGLLINMIAFFMITLVIVFSDKILAAMGYPPELSQDVHTYLFYSLPALLLFLIFNQLTTYLSAVQHFSAPAVMQIIATPFYILSCYLMIQKGGMGLIGAALSNAVMSIILVVMIIGYIKYKKPNPESLFWFDQDSVIKLWELFVHEFWVGSMVIIEWAGLEVIILFSGDLSSDQTAAFTGAISIVIVFYNIPLALSNTVMSYVGASVGENKIEKAKKYLKACILWAVVGSVIFEIIYIFFAQQLAAFVMNNADATNIALGVIHVYMIALPFDFLQYTLGSGLRALGKEKQGFIILVIAVYGIAIPTAYCLCFITGYQADGLAWGANMAFFTCFAGYTITYFAMDWEKQFKHINSAIQYTTSALQHDKLPSCTSIKTVQ